MLPLEISLIQLRIDQGSLRIGVAEERLQLLNRHPAAETGSGEGVPELVRIQVHVHLSGEFPKDGFNAAGA